MYTNYKKYETSSETTDRLIINIKYKNGDSKISDKNVSLDPRSCRTWNDVLSYLSSVLYWKENITEIRSLTGEIITGLDDMYSNETFIAVRKGDVFKRLDYSIPEKVKNTSQQNNQDVQKYGGLKMDEKSFIRIPFKSNIEQSYSNPEKVKNTSQQNNQNDLKYGGLKMDEKSFIRIPFKSNIEQRSLIFPDVNDTSSQKQFLKPITKNEQFKSQMNPTKKRIKDNKFYTELFTYIDKNVYGKDKIFNGPFGNRPIIYCDYTASGRPLKFLEEYIYQEVFPKYSNTHTTNTTISMQTTIFREEARDIIRKACNATEEDVVIFTGDGCTGAIHKLVYNLKHMNAPIVIIGPFEHHSNLLPWRHMANATYRIKIDENGGLDINDLHFVLKEQSENALKEKRQLIGVFSAASNITGILTDVNLVSSIVHQYNGIVFWDYATGAPYLEIDMNPKVIGVNGSSMHKDAVYFSMHKFVGGVQSPGILVAKKYLFTKGERDPHGAGGGTVFLVGRKNHIYLKEIEEREEGGTPNIVGDIRAGLTIQLKQFITTEAILQREKYIIEYTKSKMKNVPNIYILGDFKTERIAIFSFVIRQDVSQDNYLFLHHNFVCSLLNDPFGIQSRSGCACAGPYAADLLGIDEEMTESYMNLLSGLAKKSHNYTKVKHMNGNCDNSNLQEIS